MASGSKEVTPILVLTKKAHGILGVVSSYHFTLWEQQSSHWETNQSANSLPQESGLIKNVKISNIMHSIILGT